MCKNNSNINIYKDILSYSRDNENPSVLYNGGIKPDEDIADYVRKVTINAVKLG